MIFGARKTPIPDIIDGVPVRANARARRMALRVDNKTGDVVLVWPKRASEKSARRFIEENRQWIARQRAEIVPARNVQPGDKISVGGREYLLVHRAGRGLSHFDGDQLVICGDVAHFPRRLRDFLKREALAALKDLSDRKAAALNLLPTEVRILDPKSRWGSCGPDGRLMYSWRLILAPYDVMDYVVAHEVAHRVHFNHSRKFWTLCASLTSNAAASRRWLRSEGRQLMFLR